VRPRGREAVAQLVDITTGLEAFPAFRYTPLAEDLQQASRET
jgi:hypothetical protein